MIDLYIKNGLDEQLKPLEILVDNGKVSNVKEQFKGVVARQIIDLKSKSIISPGWIDDHTHCYENLSLYYDDPDLDGYKSGVTTVIDAGSTGADNIGEFYQTIKNKKTNIYAMVNISKTGILAQNELGDMSQIRFTDLQSVVNQYPDFIIGIKARISKSVVVSNGLAPLIEAKKIQKKLVQHLPLMVHIGSNPPLLSEIMAMMTKGDIMTHCFNGKVNGILEPNGKVKEFVKEGYRKGIIFDVGHGTDSFNFRTAEIAKKNGLVPQTLSTDIYHHNREDGPVYNMATCMEKMINLGYTLPEVLRMITINPANNYHLKNKGQLRSGYDADITIFNITDGEKNLIDSNGNKRMTTEIIEPIYSIIDGKVFPIMED